MGMAHVGLTVVLPGTDAIGAMAVVWTTKEKNAVVKRNFNEAKRFDGGTKRRRQDVLIIIIVVVVGVVVVRIMRISMFRFSVSIIACYK